MQASRARANCSWIFTSKSSAPVSTPRDKASEFIPIRRSMPCAFEDLDQQTESDLLQIVEDALGGIWEKSVSKREGRRDAMLDLIEKATPGMFRPACQIAPAGAKPLIEALSGRRSYETERR